MAEYSGKKIKEVLTRLKKLDNIENRLTELSSTLSNIEETICRLDSDVSALKVKNSDTEKKATELQETVDFSEEDISAVKMNTKKNEIQTEELKKYSLHGSVLSKGKRQIHRDS